MTIAMSILRAAGRGSRGWSLPSDLEDEIPEWASRVALAARAAMTGQVKLK